MSAKDAEFPTIGKWMRAQFGDPPCRKTATELRRDAAEFQRLSANALHMAHRVEMWEESRRAALYGINAAAAIASVRKGRK
jgi:hypothetical protein